MQRRSSTCTGYGNNAQKAYDALVQSLTLNPRQPDAAVLAGTYALGLKRYDESEKWYKRAVALEPQSVKARRHLATFYQNRGRLVEAEAELLEAQRLHPGDADVAAQLAMAVEQQPGREAAHHKVRGEALDVVPCAPGHSRRLKCAAPKAQKNFATLSHDTGYGTGVCVCV